MLKEINSLDVRTTIDLAHESAFDLGGVSVRPSTRELVAADGRREVLEPRVMQVLVALARAGGSIVTRDELTACCWEGRIVGEDAINRVISRLRRSAEGIGAGAFRVETVTKVGYRLAADGLQAAASPTPAVGKSVSPSRRAVLAAAAAGVATAGGAAVWFASRKPAEPALPDDVQQLYEEGWASLEYVAVEQNSAAVGLLRQVSERAPDYADGWASLAYAYQQSAEMGAPESRDGLTARSRSAMARAVELDPGNTIAGVVEVRRVPTPGNWWRVERGLRALLAKDPNSALVQAHLAGVMASVGRVAEAADLNAAAIRTTRRSPTLYFRQVAICMSANRLEEADRMSETAMSLYPRHYGVWFTAFYLYLYTGRAERALALAADAANRPPGIPVDEFDRISAVARASISRAREDIDRAIAGTSAMARQGAGYAENAMLFASFLDRVDEAFRLAEGYYFGRGFDPGMRSFSSEQGYFYRARRTHILFQLPAANMRADQRFERLTDEIGLKRYWAESKSTPDYLKKA